MVHRSRELASSTDGTMLGKHMDAQDIFETIQARHSVRSYTDEHISELDAQALLEEIKRCEDESGLYIEFVHDEPSVFDSTLAYYGKLSNVRNYIMLAGPLVWKI